jgi:putative thioredoxin
VDGFQGAVPESKVRELLDKHLPPADAQAQDEEEIAEEAPAALDPQARLEKLRQAVEADPASDDARFDYVKALLLSGHRDDAKVAFAPAIARTALVRRLDSLQKWMDALDFAATLPDAASAAGGFDQAISANKRDFDARFGKARLLMARERWTDAMDELLEILMRDKSWNEDAARKTYIAILDIIEPPKPKVAEGQIPPDDPMVATYRRRLSSVVLS